MHWPIHRRRLIHSHHLIAALVAFGAVVVLGIVPPMAYAANEVIYILHVSSFQSEANAETDVQRLMDQGHSAFLNPETISGRKWFRVYLGIFTDASSARDTGALLKAEGIISYFNPLMMSRIGSPDGGKRNIARADTVIHQQEPSSNGPAQSSMRKIEDTRSISQEETGIARPAGKPKEIQPRTEDPRALEMDFRGQISAWSIESRDRGSWWNNSGLRYIPQLSVKKPLGALSFVDLEVSANGFAAYESSNQDRDPELELYRLKLRYATPQTETRIGLQKLNFGPALLLRPLKWFDRLDPRDPLQLTEGVYGLRFKYDAGNNASVWFWALYGNEDLKGYESFPTSEDTAEAGLRIQYPVPRGEIAATFHSRQVDASTFHLKDFRENRFAFDARLDIGIGLWVESMLQHQDASMLPYQWQKMITIGADYTFGIGSGLYLLAEHMTTAVSEEAFQWDEDIQVSAFLLSYTLGFFDSLSAIGTYSWDLKKYGQYLSWQRTYDNLVLQVSAFHYPQSSGGALGGNQTTLGAGYGGQLMVIYNH
ncbi:MAG: SPOR domain-containing protein [Desulfobacterales bacterium]